MKQSSKGIPKNLRSLADAGERVRFNGGWLTESERDRTIAHWFDEHPRQAWTIIKELLFLYISGRLHFMKQTSEDTSQTEDV